MQMVRWKEKVPDPGRLQDSLGAWIVDKWDNRTDLSRRDVFKFIFLKDYSGSFMWIKAKFGEVRGGKDFENVETGRSARIKSEAYLRGIKTAGIIWEGNAGANGM